MTAPQGTVPPAAHKCLANRTVPSRVTHTVNSGEAGEPSP